MNPTLNVYALPTLLDEETLRNGLVVVIDVLRASTTIITALAAGAQEVLPREHVDDARTTAEQLPADKVLLGGERGALAVDGFDLGNSPAEYTQDVVADHTIVLTTTNGTVAMARCRLANRVLIGAFVNASAIVHQLAQAEQVHLLCAGHEGQMSYDDILFAGMLVERLQRRAEMAYELHAQALTACETWKHAFALPIAIGAEPLEPECLAAKLYESLGAKALIEAGLTEDILSAAWIDRYPIIPEMDPKTMRIVISSQ